MPRWPRSSRRSPRPALTWSCTPSRADVGRPLELGATRRRDVERYVVLVAQELLLVEQILALAEELKSGTIERMLAKSDLELGLEALGVNLP